MRSWRWCGVNLINLECSQRINTDWLWEHFPPETRFATMIFISDNILDPDVIRSMYRVHKGIFKEKSKAHKKLTPKKLLMQFFTLYK